jgi:iron complex outermembrane receptor protein
VWGVVLLAAASLPAWAQETDAQKTDVQKTGDVQNLSIEQLADVQITSVSRRPEPLNQAPASVYVITAEDIRRSGYGSLPDVLRLAPNLEVAKINGYAYTITARGFNSSGAANKLLVLIDGRSVYSPLGSTVFWENIDVPLVNIERIEVVSGPGGTLYGANAVNGVINIITKNAADAKGGMLDARLGLSGDNFGNGYRGVLRYGFTPWDGGSVYLYGQLSHGGGTPPVKITDTSQTGWVRDDLGFRFDQILGRDSFNFEGDLYADHTPDQNLEKARGGNMNVHWVHAFDSGDSFSAQISGDDATRILPGTSREQLNTYDLQLQHNMSLGWNDAFIWGGEYKQFKESYYSSTISAFADPTTTISLENIFAQDVIPLLPDLKLTLGLKAENNSYSGLDLMPNVRLAWQITDSGMIWAAASQAVRTPSKVDRELDVPGLVEPSPNFGSEKLTAYELGYRDELLPRLSFSASLYYNVYGDLRSEQGMPVTIVPVALANGAEEDTYGAEIWGSYGLTDWWRLNAGVNWLGKDFRNKPGFMDLGNGASGGTDPATQVQLRSQMNLYGNWEFDAGLRSVGEVTQATPTAAKISLVPAYVEADVRLGWHVFPRTEVDFSGTNLLHDRHLEANDSGYAPQYIPRSFVISLRQSF